MREVLRQLSGIPGVVGALVAGPRGELLGAEFPPLFDEVALHQAASLFADETSGFRRIAGTDGLLQLRYSHGRAMLRPFASGTLLVLGTAAADTQLLGLTLEQAIRRLEKGSAPPLPPPPAAAPPSDAARVREGLAEALARQIGPVAAVVLDEAWAAWQASGPASRTGLEKLVADLAREVDDEAGRARFLEEARGLLR